MADTKLMPEQEQEFQRAKAGFDPSVREWQSKFQTVYGEKPRMEGDPSFDYRKAFQAGDRPQKIESDVVPHWPSTGKAENHPTEWMEKFMQKFGVDPGEVMEKPDKQTPEMREWLRTNLPIPNLSELLRAITADPRLLEVLDSLRRSQTK